MSWSGPQHTLSSVAPPTRRDLRAQPLYQLQHANLVQLGVRSSKMRKMESILSRFRALLPQSFLPGYKNPCWYASYHLEQWAKQLETAFPFDGVHHPSVVKQVAISRQVIDGMQRKTGSKSLVCLPAFFLPGYSKCGTTELYELLRAHPNFASPVSKELNWWTGEEWRSLAPLNTSYLLHYFSHFAPAAHLIELDPAHRITGDMSVLSAFELPFKLPRIATYDDALPFLLSSLLPHSKIIFLMRNPIYKVRSAYYFFSKFDCVRKPSPQAFHEGVTDQLDAYRHCVSKVHIDGEYECLFRFTSYVNITIKPCHMLMLPQAVYYHSVRLWLRHFPRDQVLFLRMEDMAHNVSDVALKVFAFLGLSPPSPQVLKAVAQKAKVRANANPLLSALPEAATMWTETKSLLRDFFTPFNKKLADLLQDSRYLWEE